MSNILIIGNTIKDTYLQLDTNTTQLELDHNHTAWLDLAFDNHTQHYLKHTSIFSGSITAAEILCNFGHTVFLNDATVSCKYREFNVISTENPDHRYILTYDSNVVYFSPSIRKITKWKLPKDQISWILIDNSVNPDQNFLKNLNAYLTFARNTKLALVCPNHPNPIISKIAEFADLVFTTSSNIKTSGKICLITENSIKLGRSTEFYHHPKPHLATQLNITSILSATVLGALINGEPDSDAIKLAKINAENSNLNNTLEFSVLQELSHQDPTKSDTNLIAKSLISDKKSLFFTHETTDALRQKFKLYNIPDSLKNRQAYYQLLFSSSNISNYLSGIILSEDIAFQPTSNGQKIIDLITQQGIISGININQNLLSTSNFKESHSKTLDNLDRHLVEYYQAGIRFAKWRTVFDVSQDALADQIIDHACLTLAQFAKKCQSKHILPVLELTLSPDSEYSAKQATLATVKILQQLFKMLHKYSVELSSCILATHTIQAGKNNLPLSPSESGRLTAQIFKKVIPKNLSGIIFLANEHNQQQLEISLTTFKKQGAIPWGTTLSFSDTFQLSILESWQGNNANITKAQNTFLHRLAEITKNL